MDDFGDESEDEGDDVDMKEFEGMAAQNDDDELINDVISDIDSDDPALYQPPPQYMAPPSNQGRVPGLQLGGLGLSSLAPTNDMLAA